MVSLSVVQRYRYRSMGLGMFVSLTKETPHRAVR
jgi:hypothetical protein